jgi:hypothetical protein
MSPQRSTLAALVIFCTIAPAQAGFYIETIRLGYVGGLGDIVFTEPHGPAVTHSYPGTYGDSARSATFSSDPAPYVYATASAVYDQNSFNQAGIGANLRYSFEVSGAAGTFVPVIFKGRLEVHNDNRLSDSRVSAEFSADGASGRTSYLLGERVRLFTACTGNFTNGVGCYSETSVGDPSEYLGGRSAVTLTQGIVSIDADRGASAVGTFTGTLMTPVSALGKGSGSIMLDVDVLTGSIDAMTASILSWGIIDPELRIDPQYLAAHPGASLSLPPGVGAEMLAAPVPEISTLAMMLAGLSLTGMAAARRRAA